MNILNIFKKSPQSASKQTVDSVKDYILEVNEQLLAKIELLEEEIKKLQYKQRIVEKRKIKHDPSEKVLDWEGVSDGSVLCYYNLDPNCFSLDDNGSVTIIGDGSGGGNAVITQQSSDWWLTKLNDNTKFLQTGTDGDGVHLKFIAQGTTSFKLRPYALSFGVDSGTNELSFSGGISGIQEHELIKANDTGFYYYTYDGTEHSVHEGWNVKDISAGSNISIVETDGDYTISATGGTGGLTSVSHDDTLTGSGTSSSELGINFNDSLSRWNVEHKGICLYNEGGDYHDPSSLDFYFTGGENPFIGLHTYKSDGQEIMKFNQLSSDEIRIGDEYETVCLKPNPTYVIGGALDYAVLCNHLDPSIFSVNSNNQITVTGGTGGLTSVATDSTLTGNGTATNELKVANPFSPTTYTVKSMTGIGTVSVTNVSGVCTVIGSIVTDSTLTGAGTSGSKLKVASPFDSSLYYNKTTSDGRYLQTVTASTSQFTGTGKSGSALTLNNTDISDTHVTFMNQNYTSANDNFFMSVENVNNSGKIMLETNASIGITGADGYSIIRAYANKANSVCAGNRRMSNITNIDYDGNDNWDSCWEVPCVSDFDGDYFHFGDNHKIQVSAALQWSHWLQTTSIAAGSSVSVKITGIPEGSTIISAWMTGTPAGVISFTESDFDSWKTKKNSINVTIYNYSNTAIAAGNYIIVSYS
jgi:hypothetical protein